MLRFYMQARNVGNVYVANVRFYNQATAASGRYVDLRSAVTTDDFAAFWSGSAKTAGITPPGLGAAATVLTLGTVSGSDALSNYMPLKVNTDYVLEFDYWGDAAGDKLITDLYPGMNPTTVLPDVQTAVQHERIVINSSSDAMNSCCLKFY